jgi:uncharacterized protein with HEPN domain
MREYKDFLFDVIDTIELIENHVKCTIDVFIADVVLTDFVCFRLMSIGEALSKVPKEYRKDYKEIPWKKIIGMRNLLTHEYYEIDACIIYNSIKDDLPLLKQSILKIISDNGWTEEYVDSKS